MATILHDSAVAIIIVRTHEKTMRKSVHGLPFLSYMGMGMGHAELTTPLMTLIFDFHLVVSSLIIPPPIQAMTLSLVKTSL